MMKSKIPSCFFPTKVVLIDDDISFLKSICMSLTGERATYAMYDSPQEAQKFLNEEYCADPFSSRVLSKADNFDLEKTTVNVNLREIHKEVYNAKRFEQVSVIVVDYAMPGMNGLELCESIQDESIQKILLTGAADENLAIDAFNKGIINKFVPKQCRDMPEVLRKAIEDAQSEYFVKLSKHVTGNLLDRPEIKTAMNDQGYIDLFNKIRVKEKIAEHYLLDIFGSQLFVDANGKVSALFLKDSDTVEANYMEVQDEEEFEDSLKAQMKEGEKILCYYSLDGNPYPESAQWSDYLCSANKLEGASGVYRYAYPCKMEGMETDKLLPYKDYSSEFYKKK